jgi:hypothetical protein
MSAAHDHRDTLAASQRFARGAARVVTGVTGVAGSVLTGLARAARIGMKMRGRVAGVWTVMSGCGMTIRVRMGGVGGSMGAMPVAGGRVSGMPMPTMPVAGRSVGGRSVGGVPMPGMPMR